MGHLGFPDPSTGVVNRYSPYLILDNNAFSSSISNNSPPPASPIPVTNSYSQITNISLVQACKSVTLAIKQEKGFLKTHHFIFKFVSNNLILKRFNFRLASFAIDIKRITTIVAKQSFDIVTSYKRHCFVS